MRRLLHRIIGKICKNGKTVKIFTKFNFRRENPLTIKLISDTIIVYNELYKKNIITLANLPKDRDAKLSV